MSAENTMALVPMGKGRCRGNHG